VAASQTKAEGEPVMQYRGVLHIVRMLPTHCLVVFAQHDSEGADEALASCATEGPTELHDFLQSAGVKPEVVKEVLQVIIEKNSYSVEGLKFSDEDIGRLFPQVAQT
jgi:hypothetical protein